MIELNEFRDRSGSRIQCFVQHACTERGLALKPFFEV